MANKKNILTTEIIVKENKIGIMRINNVNYISLTDLARYKDKDKDRTDYIVQNWMRTINTILFLGTWEFLNNPDFNSVEFDGFKNEFGTNAFVMTAKEWRDSNPKLAQNGNMRDYTDLLHLVILNNLQNINAILIEEKLSQRERLIRLNNSARRQMEALKDNKNLKELELL